MEAVVDTVTRSIDKIRRVRDNRAAARDAAKEEWIRLLNPIIQNIPKGFARSLRDVFSCWLTSNWGLSVSLGCNRAGVKGRSPLYQSGWSAVSGVAVATRKFAIPRSYLFRLTNAAKAASVCGAASAARQRAFSPPTPTDCSRPERSRAPVKWTFDSCDCWTESWHRVIPPDPDSCADIWQR